MLLLEQEGGFFQSQYSAVAPALKQANNSTYLLNFKLKCLEYPLHKTLEASCMLFSASLKQRKEVYSLPGDVRVADAEPGS